MIMNKTVNATEPKDKLKQLALEFIDGKGSAHFEHWETVTLGGRVDVFGDVKPYRSDNYYISILAELPSKCKYLNEITVSATCIATEDEEDVFECKIENLGLTKKQLASFKRRIKSWSLDYK